MAEQASASRSLVELLARLQLATAAEVEGVRPLVARLGRELPNFDSLWVDGLAQARVLTPYQAAQINAGRGEALQVGPYLLRGELPGSAFARCYSAVHPERGAAVRLMLVERSEQPLDSLREGLTRLVEQSRLLEHPALPAVLDAGLDGPRIWAVCPVTPGVTAARWIVENGRLPGAAVLSIARQMVAALAELERLELVHGDLSAGGLLLADDGRIALPHAGVRPIVRPVEGYAYGDLAPRPMTRWRPSDCRRLRRQPSARKFTPAVACGGT